MSDDDATAVAPASDISRVWPPSQYPMGFAADSRPEVARAYPAGKELASAANKDKAHNGNANLAH